MSREKFYVTTPIYYVNDQPHIGHAYTSLAADVLSIYHRMLGERVWFLTGTDEHGQKVEQAASAKGRSPKEHADLMVGNFKALWEKLCLTHNDFIRTTDADHKAVVQEMLQKLYDARKIVKRKYSGWYCTPCERFWTSKDIKEGNCPDCNRPVEEIEEENYFFLMSEYHERLERHIRDNPGFILPETRRNEVLGFLKAGPLQDLCISRPKKRLSWGIELPFDPEFVTYVWFDALLNYYSATRYLLKDAGGTDDEGDGGLAPWPADVHLIGKDILTTHAVYWSTMLMAMGIDLPRTIFAHGWWTIDGHKMSKSVGNVVDPADISHRYGNDAFRYFLFREVPFGNDGDFSETALINRLNTDLANDLGNLLSRTLKMIGRYFDGVIPERNDGYERNDQGVTSEGRVHLDEGYIQGRLKKETTVEILDGALGKLDFHAALIYLWSIIADVNKYIAEAEPWKINHRGVLANRLYTAAEALRLIALYIRPFMPGAAGSIWKQLGINGIEKATFDEHGGWAGLRAGTKLGELETLFPRIVGLKGEVKVETSVTGKLEKEKKNSVEDKDAEEKKDNIIKIDDVMKVELKTGLVKTAEKVEGADKLLRLEVDTGDPEPRQIVAGIAMAYAPEALVGKNIIVVTNLKPAKLRGIVSQGMLLAATGEDGLPVIVTTEKPVAPGLRVK